MSDYFNNFHTNSYQETRRNGLQNSKTESPQRSYIQTFDNLTTMSDIHYENNNSYYKQQYLKLRHALREERKLRQKAQDKLSNITL